MTEKSRIFRYSCILDKYAIGEIKGCICSPYQFRFLGSCRGLIRFFSEGWIRILIFESWNRIKINQILNPDNDSGYLPSGHELVGSYVKIASRGHLLYMAVSILIGWLLIIYLNIQTSIDHLSIIMICPIMCTFTVKSFTIKWIACFGFISWIKLAQYVVQT